MTLDRYRIYPGLAKKRFDLKLKGLENVHATQSGASEPIPSYLRPLQGSIVGDSTWANAFLATSGRMIGAKQETDGWPTVSEASRLTLFPLRRRRSKPGRLAYSK